MTHERMLSMLKREPSVLKVYLVGSALEVSEPKDLDVLVIFDGRPGSDEALLNKYMDVQVLYGGRSVPVDLHLHSTNVPIDEWIGEVYSRPVYREV